MMCSVDGRILTKNWGKLPGIKTYEETGKKHKADAWMCGRVTMERDFASTEPLKLQPHTGKVQRKDFIATKKAKTYAIAVDKDGKLNWQEPAIDGDHLVSVLLESVNDAYLVYLQQKGISYIFGGAIEIDFKLVLEKLRKQFGIKTLLLEGGGHLNASLMQEGLVDELSLLYIPIADGTPGATTLLEITGREDGLAANLKLQKVKELDNDVVWMRYAVRK